MGFMVVQRLTGVAINIWGPVSIMVVGIAFLHARRGCGSPRRRTYMCLFHMNLVNDMSVSDLLTEDFSFESSPFWTWNNYN